jgi:MYXO-CTERM domain-containing protein
VLLVATGARADSTITLKGQVPTDGPDHFFVPFTVPANTAEIEIAHDDESADNILDWGLYDPAGNRGWGGGNSENVVVNASAASRSYVPGPVTAGEWKVVVGKAKIVKTPATYSITVTFRDVATLAPQTRSPYAPVAALRKGPAWYAGDFHAHSRESGDAKPTLDEMVQTAKNAGLDFVEISDHNVVTQLDLFAGTNTQGLLLVPGIEYTTYAGHANAIGATKWVDHKIGQPGVTIDGAADAVHAQGALFSINHPTLDLGDLCIGCAWKQPLAEAKVDAVEIATGGWRQSGLLFSASAQAKWDAICGAGHHVAAIGGSDDHTAGQSTGARDSPIGSPTTMVFADELSVAGILDAIKKGRTVVKLQDAKDPMVEVFANRASGGDAMIGDGVAARGTTLRAVVKGAGAGNVGYWVKNGERGAELALNGGEETFSLPVRAPASGEDRYRFEVWSGSAMRTMTGHVYVTFAEAGSDPTIAPAASGCACTTSGADGSSIAVAIAALAILRSRRARRRMSA